MAGEQDPSRTTSSPDLTRPPSGLEGLPQPSNLPATQGDASRRLPQPTQKASGNGLKGLEKRATNAETPEEALKWVRVRGELSQQKREESVDRNRFIAGIATVAVSLASISSGTFLALHGQESVGIFVLGAGVYGIAPDYVKTFIGRFFGGGR